ncbi:MAG: PAS domain S-box protein [Anaerolineaceae bacterium]|nr:PAS domain S-box protein [Anaerolineaceae bacterium]
MKMTDTANISAGTLCRLQARAEREGCSVDEIVARLLDKAEPPSTKPVLKHSAAMLHAVFESLPFDFWAMDAEGTYILQNATCNAHWGNRVGRKLKDLDIPEHLLSQWQENDRQAFAGEIVTAEVSYTHQGEKHHYHDIIFPVYDRNTIIGIMGMNVDISERKKAEAALAEERRLFNGGPTVIFRWRAESSWPVEYVSPNVFEELGYTPLEFTSGKIPYSSIVHPDDMARLNAEIAAYYSTGRTEFEQEYRIRHADGRYRWFYDFSSVTWSTDGEAMGYRGYIQDITERKQLEEALRRQNDSLTFLHQVTLDLLNYRNRTDLLQSIIDHAAAIMDAPYVEISFLEGDELVVQGNTANQIFIVGDRVKRGEGLLSWKAYDTHQVVTLDDYATFSGRRAIYNHISFHAVACFPIMVGEKCLGVLDVSRTEPGVPFTSDEIQQGVLFSHLIALLLENTRLHDAAAQEIDQRRQAETALRTSEERYRSLIESSDAAISMLDIDGRYLFLNAIAAQNFGKSPEALVGKTVGDLFPPDETTRILRDVREVIENDQGMVLETTSTINERPCWFRTSIQPVHDSASQPIAVIVYASEITERKLAEIALQEREATVQSILRSAPIGIGLVKGRVFEWVNITFCRQIGYAREELIGQSARMIYPDDAEFEHVGQVKYAQIAESGIGTVETRFRRKDGAILNVLLSSTPIIPGDSSAGTIFSVLDITERKLAEIALQEREATMQSILRSAPIGIGLLKQRVFEWINDSFCQQTGYTREELIGKSVRLIYPDDATFEHMGQVIVQNDFSTAETRFRRKDGTILDFLVSSSYIDPTDWTAGVISSAMDITERKQAEKALQQSQTLYQSLVDSLPINIYRLDLEGRVTFANRSMLENIGLPLEALAGKTAYDFYSPDLAEKYRHDDAMVIKSGAVMRFTEVNVTPHSGEHRYVEVIKLPIYDSQGQIEGLQGAFWDITERMEMEAALRDSEARYRGVVEDTPLLMCSFRHEGEITFANQAFCDYFSRTGEELVGANFLDFIPESDRDQVIANITALTSGSPIHSHEHRAITPDGAIRWQRWSNRALFDAEGKVTLYQAIGEDITEQKRAQKLALDHERLKTRFRQEEEQNILIQRTISALNHDLRTPLTVISTAKNILSRYYDQLTIEKRQEKLDSIERQLQYALDLLDDTVTLVRGNLNERDFNPAPLNLDTLCRVSVSEIGETNRKGHNLIFTNTGQVEIVPVDEILVSRILLNLLSNAVKYSPNSSDITLELDRRGDDWIVLRVTDQGMGITEEDMLHIFEPFYRSAEVRSIGGSGLGLSIVKDCVERHRGHISVESESGLGSIFTVELPTQVNNDH